MIERTVADAIDAWAFIRRNTIAEIANLPADRFDHRPHPDARDIAELCHHIIDSGLMFAGEICSTHGSFARKPMPALYAEYAGPGPKSGDRSLIIQRMEDTWTDMRRSLAAARPGFLVTEMRTMDDGPVARLRMLHFASAHEFYHAGQLTVYARTLGVVPALTRQFQAMIDAQGG